MADIVTTATQGTVTVQAPDGHVLVTTVSGLRVVIDALPWVEVVPNTDDCRKKPKKHKPHKGAHRG